MLSRTKTGRLPPSSQPAAKNAILEKALPQSGTKISTKSPVKLVAPLGNKRHTTVFSAVYSKGGIPCRLQHGSVKHKLTWNQAPESLDYNPLFVTFCEGLREAQHPFRFIVEKGLVDLIDAPGSFEKIKDLMPTAISALRNGLAVKEKDLFLTSLNIFTKLVVLLGPDMEPFLAAILPPIASKVLAPDSQVREAVHDALSEVQIHGSDQTLAIIRKRVPTYNPTLMN